MVLLTFSGIQKDGGIMMDACTSEKNHLKWIIDSIKMCKRVFQRVIRSKQLHIWSCYLWGRGKLRRNSHKDIIYKKCHFQSADLTRCGTFRKATAAHIHTRRKVRFPLSACSLTILSSSSSSSSSYFPPSLSSFIIITSSSSSSSSLSHLKPKRRGKDIRR